MPVVNPGIRRFLASAIQRLFNGASFYAPLTHSLVPTRGTGTPTYTRATTATVRDNEGVLRTAIAGEARFEGARRVGNLIPTTSENLSNAAWTKQSATISGTNTIVEAAATSIHRVVIGGSPTPSAGVFCASVDVTAGTRRYVVLGIVSSTSEIWAAVDTQTWTITQTGNAVNGTYIASSLTANADGTYRLSVIGSLSITGAAINYGGSATGTPGAATPSYLGDGSTFIGNKFQLENITGRADQTTPSEYVSVGATSGNDYGAELITNGAFDSDSWWSKSAGATISGGTGITTASGAPAYLYSPAITTVSGKNYTFYVDVISPGSKMVLRIGTTSVGTEIYFSPAYLTAAGRYAYNFVATSTTTYITLLNDIGGGTAIWDNASVKENLFHGSMVDGVKCFPTDLAGNPLPTSYTYDAVSLNGVAGTYVSTPDSVAASITGDIDIRVKAALADWTPSGGYMALCSKFGAAGNRSWIFDVAQTTGKLRLWSTNDGTTATSAQESTVAPTVSDGATLWVRVTRVATGTNKFYTSDDGITWTQLGADVATAAFSMFDSTAPVEIGGYASGTGEVLSGKIYRAQIYNGINGTLAVDFDASRYAGGSTLTGSTGETWTLQGNAVIHPTNSPMLGYLAEGARTNLSLQSEDLGAVGVWGPGAVADSDVTTNVFTAPNGTLTMDKMREKATTAPHYYIQNATLTVAPWTYSHHFAAAERSIVWMYMETSVRAIAYFNLATGTVGTVSGTGSPSARMKLVSPGIYRCELTATPSVAGIAYGFGTAVTDNVLSFAGTATYGVYAWGSQLELGSFASSYIPTTTIAVARNADVLYYSSSNNLSTLSDYSLYCEAKLASTSPVFLGTLIGGNSAYQPLLTASLEANKFDGYSNSAGTGAATVAISDALKTSQINKYASSKSTTLTVAANGTAGTGAALGAQGSDLTRIEIGSASGGSSGYANIRNVRIWQRALSSSELQAVTA